MDQIAREIIANQILPQIGHNLWRVPQHGHYYHGNDCSFQNHKKSKGVGLFLQYINDNPGTSLPDLRKNLNLHSQYAETFMMMRYAQIVKSEKGKYFITRLGKQYLDILPEN